MGYVHYCVFCGHSHPAGTPAMLEPSCPACGCALRACRDDEFEAVQASLRDGGTQRRARLDGAGPLAVMTAGPFLLPLVGLQVRDVIFAVPIVFLVFAAAIAASAARRRGEPRYAWLAYAAGAGLTATGFALDIVLRLAGFDSVQGRDVAALASVALLAGLAVHLRARLRHATTDKLLGAVQPLVPVVAIVVYAVVVPGFARGAGVAALAVLAGVAAFFLAGLLAASARRRQDIAVGRRLWAMALVALAADSLLALDVAGTGFAHAAETAAALDAVAAWLLAGAAVSERPALRRQDRRDDDATPGFRGLAARVLGATIQVAALPAMLAVAVAVDGPGAWPIAWFGAAFLAVVVAAFGRQAQLVIEHRTAVVEERRQRRQAQRRNEELEALTGLATTMTQTLEEGPIVEQALGVLHTAARASSSALHMADNGRRRLRASAGDWQSELPWAGRLPDSDERILRFERGGRQITRLRLLARGHDIGDVTLVRRAADPLADRELDLLRLLVDQMAIAIQNARDYREKLEQAVRDPLTGVYNRRYLFEALEKEVQRTLRYGSHAALVLFDVDDFKRINDTYGHAVGDDVLRGIALAVEPLLRPSDSFARIGGEEFALLLPETAQLDALLVAERLRSAISRAELVSGARVTVSAGVGACPQDATTREELVRRTDAALYWAKRNGKDLCAVVNEATDATRDDAALGREAALRHLLTLVAAIDGEELHTHDHSERVAGYAVALGNAVGLEHDHIVRLRSAALLHDVGKVAVRPEVLGKPAELSDAQRAEIRLHAGVGATMLRHAGLLDEAEWVRHHHERVDGGGYPDGLAGDAIPLEARIILVADAFEAMTSDRPYRAGMDTADALAELRRCAGTQFDARLVELFCELVEAGEVAVVPLRSDAVG